VIRAIIFDLDNCLSPGDAMGRAFLQPVFDAIRAANDGTVAEQQLTAAFDEMWRVPIDAVAKKHGFSEAMLRAGWEISRGLAIPGSMKGYEDLGFVRELAVKRYLVTSGFRRMQESKIRALGIEGWFDETWIDAIDEGDRKGKQRLFDEIAKRGRFEPSEVLVVGDNPDAEIAAGNRLGMRTVQILRPGVKEGSNATRTIRSLRELRGVIEELKGDAQRHA
jgi:putative hydrolase of the HAD superfamily